MIPVASATQAGIATGVADMRRGMNGLMLPVGERLGCQAHPGGLHVFREHRDDLIECFRHDGGCTTLRCCL